jgi:hypothetical protein
MGGRRARGRSVRPSRAGRTSIASPTSRSCSRRRRRRWSARCSVTCSCASSTRRRRGDAAAPLADRRVSRRQRRALPGRPVLCLAKASPDGIPPRCMTGRSSRRTASTQSSRAAICHRWRLALTPDRARHAHGADLDRPGQRSLPPTTSSTRTARRS